MQYMARVTQVLTVLILSLLILQTEWVVGESSDAGNKAVAEAGQATSVKAATLSEIVVPLTDLKEELLAQVLDTVREKTGVGIVLIDVEKEGKRLLFDGQRISMKLEKPVSFAEFLQLLAKKCEGLRWKILGGAVVVFPVGLNDISDNPLSFKIPKIEFTGTLSDLLRKINGEVPTLYLATRSGNPSAFDKQIIIKTQDVTSVDEILAKLSAEMGFRWKVVIKEKVEEQTMTIETKGKPETKRTLSQKLKKRTDIRVALSAKDRKAVMVREE
ncbi:MAG: hypothetical protein WBD63_03115 [Phycisphaerae bacterium]|nr:hypothetical protein [Phycisphaerae bacterium]